MHLKLYIDRLEQFSVHCGATVIRNSLVGGVLGRVDGRRIVLRSGLSLERQVLTLAHELTHLIAHCNVSPRLNRTVCEYEAEAVERWVGAELKVSPYAEEGLDFSSLTDDLLAGSVVRVRWVARTLVSAARDGVSAAVERARLQA
jgi:IrrE N-terminal-like domain